MVPNNVWKGKGRRANVTSQQNPFEDPKLIDMEEVDKFEFLKKIKPFLGRVFQGSGWIDRMVR